MGILFKCRRLFTHSTLITLYNSFLYPHFNYCISVWGNTFESYLEPLVKLQKRAVRVILGTKRNTHTNPIFKKLKILKIRQTYVYTVQQFVFKFYKKKCYQVFLIISIPLTALFTNTTQEVEITIDRLYSIQIDRIEPLELWVCVRIIIFLVAYRWIALFCHIKQH